MKLNVIRKSYTFVYALVLSVFCLSLVEVAQAGNKKIINVLMVGGGSSHDFDRWYKDADVKTLERGNLSKVVYLDNVNAIREHLPLADVLILTNNQPIEDAKTRAAIFNFVKEVKGLILAHAALWYNWADWPEYNNQLVSGGSRGHDNYGNFKVSLSDKKHPVTKGVDKTFELKDELYYYKVDPSGPGIEVLASATSDGTTSFPSVFIVKNPKARIVGIALGHDEASHGIANYQTLLRNAVKWDAKK